MSHYPRWNAFFNRFGEKGGGERERKVRQIKLASQKREEKETEKG